MKGSVRITLLGVFAAALMVLSPCSTPSAHAGPVAAEMNLNSSTVQVVHNTPANTDVLNLNLNVESSGDTGTCGDANDLLETGVHVAVSRFSCFGYFIACIGLTGCPVLDFDAEVDYVEHDIGSTSYGTSFAPNAAGFVASKIVALTTPPLTCGTWSINLQGTGQNLSLITGPKVALILADEDDEGPLGSACFDVNVNVGNGIVKLHQGVHRARR